MWLELRTDSTNYIV